jgi:hypothetical protein
MLMAVFLVVPFLCDFYGLILPRSETHYLGVIVAPAIWVSLVCFVWRAGLMERYLSVDLGQAGADQT